MPRTDTHREQFLARMTVSKPHRKGATEAQIFADNAKARKTAQLQAELRAGKGAK